MCVGREDVVLCELSEVGCLPSSLLAADIGMKLYMHGMTTIMVK